MRHCFDPMFFNRVNDDHNYHASNCCPQQMNKQPQFISFVLHPKKKPNMPTNMFRTEKPTPNNSEYNNSHLIKPCKYILPSSQQQNPNSWCFQPSNSCKTKVSLHVEKWRDRMLEPRDHNNPMCSEINRRKSQVCNFTLLFSNYNFQNRILFVLS